MLRSKEGERLLNLYKEYHKDPNKYPGATVTRFRGDIQKFIKENGPVTSCLDYGCGKGYQYMGRNLHEEWGIEMPTLYDPAVPNHNKRPNRTFDMVLSTDVMEHIAEEDVPDVLADIMSLSDRLVFLSISCRPAVALLPNGENAHSTVKPWTWWQEQVEKQARPGQLVLALCQPGETFRVSKT